LSHGTLGSVAAHGPTAARLGLDRWHFQHGPIDLIVEVRGDTGACERAVADCWERFATVLPVLVAELVELRRPTHERPAVRGPVALRMLRACAPFAAERFVTPMAAVAGAVADDLIESFRRTGIRLAFINNGGDIALYLTPGEVARVGICANAELARMEPSAGPRLDARFVIDAAMPVRGLATSGWRGRSFSLGIADSVTVLAGDAAAADAAATLIANAVDCDHPAIVRKPADQLKDDTDLGCRPVTVAVPPLPPALRAAALRRGRAEAERWRDRGLIHAAALLLQGETDVVLPRTGSPPMPIMQARSSPPRPAIRRSA
jgi:ApbE superfamily uncharacterized protein (UPF0280 family)